MHSALPSLVADRVYECGIRKYKRAKESPAIDKTEKKFRRTDLDESFGNLGETNVEFD